MLNTRPAITRNKLAKIFTTTGIINYRIDDSCVAGCCDLFTSHAVTENYKAAFTQTIIVGLKRGFFCESDINKMNILRDRYVVSLDTNGIKLSKLIEAFIIYSGTGSWPVNLGHNLKCCDMNTTSIRH